MMENQTSNAEVGDKTLKLVNVGETLRKAREQAGLSVADIADRIKFAPRQVEALEANDFAHLPQAPFLRGFVRSYARMLQLDEASLLGSLPEAHPHQEPSAPRAVEVAFRNPLAMSRINLVWLGGAMGLILLLALFLLLPAKQEVKLEQVVEEVALPAGGDAASAVAMPEQPVVAEQKREAAGAVEKPVVAVKQQDVQERKAPAVRPAIPPQQAAAASAPAATTIPIELLRRRPMHFVFTGDTWVEVKDTNGELLLSRTNPNGTEKWIGGPNRAPYDVTINHPERVRLYYKGREIDLSAHFGKGVAHFNVE